MNADMREPMTPEYVFRIIQTSSNLWTRDGLAAFLGVDRRNKLFARALDVLKAQGKITEDWLANGCVRINITKAPETAHDAPEAQKADMGSTEAVGCGRGQDEGISDPPPFCGMASDDRIQDAVQKMLDTIPRQDTRPKSADELPELASFHLAALIADYRRVIDEWRLMKLQVEDTEGLREEMRQLRETNNRLLTDSLAYIALKEKLRGMLDE